MKSAVAQELMIDLTSYAGMVTVMQVVQRTGYHGFPRKSRHRHVKAVTLHMPVTCHLGNQCVPPVTLPVSTCHKHASASVCSEYRQQWAILAIVAIGGTVCPFQET